MKTPNWRLREGGEAKSFSFLNLTSYKYKSTFFSGLEKKRKRIFATLEVDFLKMGYCLFLQILSHPSRLFVEFWKIVSQKNRYFSFVSWGLLIHPQKAKRENERFPYFLFLSIDSLPYSSSQQITHRRAREKGNEWCLFRTIELLCVESERFIMIFSNSVTFPVNDHLTFHSWKREMIDSSKLKVKNERQDLGFRKRKTGQNFPRFY